GGFPFMLIMLLMLFCLFKALRAQQRTMNVSAEGDRGEIGEFDNPHMIEKTQVGSDGQSKRTRGEVK
ncbi:MAG: hypothetical protein PVH84_01470, partial [Candidatus Aminicenantes bacterium]